MTQPTIEQFAAYLKFRGLSAAGDVKENAIGFWAQVFKSEKVKAEHFSRLPFYTNCTVCVELDFTDIYNSDITAGFFSNEHGTEKK